MRTKRLRGVAVATGVAAAFYLIYAGAANFLLSSRVLRDLIESPRFRLEYDSASSWWPGRVRVRGLRISGADENVQWECRIEDVHFGYSVLDLARKRFHATGVRGAGLEFHLRPQPRTPAARGRDDPAMPAVAGFSDVGGGAKLPPPTPLSEAAHLWTVVVEDLDARPVREIWIGQYRYRGSAGLHGGFFLRPRLRAEIGPAMLVVDDGVLRAGHDLVARPPAGRVWCRISPYAPFREPGSAVLRFLSARIDLGGEIAGLEFLNQYFSRSGDLRWEDGAGRFAARLRFRGGKGGGSVALRAPVVAASTGGRTYRGGVNARFRLSGADLARMRLSLAGSSIELGQLTGFAESGGGRPWSCRLAATEGALDLKGRASFHGRLSLRADDARPLYQWLHVGIPGWAKKIMTLENLDADSRVRFAPGELRVEKFEASGEHFRIRGRYERSGRVRTGAFLIRSGVFALGIGVDADGGHVHLLGPTKWFERESK